MLLLWLVRILARAVSSQRIDLFVKTAVVPPWSVLNGFLEVARLRRKLFGSTLICDTEAVCS